MKFSLILLAIVFSVKSYSQTFIFDDSSNRSKGVYSTEFLKKRKFVNRIFFVAKEFLGRDYTEEEFGNTWCSLDSIFLITKNRNDNNFFYNNTREFLSEDSLMEYRYKYSNGFISLITSKNLIFKIKKPKKIFKKLNIGKEYRKDSLNLFGIWDSYSSVYYRKGNISKNILDLSDSKGIFYDLYEWEKKMIIKLFDRYQDLLVLSESRDSLKVAIILGSGWSNERNKFYVVNDNEYLCIPTFFKKLYHLDKIYKSENSKYNKKVLFSELNSFLDCAYEVFSQSFFMTYIFPFSKNNLTIFYDSIEGCLFNPTLSN